MKTFCFKLYRAARNAKLHRQINAAGLTYNHCIALHRRYYRLFKKTLHKFTLMKHLVKLKKLKKFSYLKEFGSQAVQDVAERIDRAYQLFFGNLKRKVRCSPPKFKKVRRYKSFTLKQNGWKLDEDNHTIIIRRQKYRYFEHRKGGATSFGRDTARPDSFGQVPLTPQSAKSGVCHFKDRRIIGKVKTVTIKRDSLGDIYVYIVTDAKNLEVETRTGKVAGFDFGLKTFLTAAVGFIEHKGGATSFAGDRVRLSSKASVVDSTICLSGVCQNGKDITSPLFFASNSRAIAKASRELSRKSKDSNNRRRARLQLARLHKKAANCRHDFHFKLARRLCLEYDTICIEDLNVKAMQRRYGKKISDLAFSDFVRILKYEATKFGTLVIEVDRFFASSQLCHCCGAKNPQLKDLKVRQWVCPSCGAEHDRDRNAAINILQEGLGRRPSKETE